jgi:hypothetical protein
MKTGRAAFLVPILATLAIPAPPALAQAAPDSARAIIDHACDAVGGVAALRAIPILQATITSEEVTNDGHTSKSSQRIFFAPPGPTPGRLEFNGSGVVVGDDGTGGWAITHGMPDARPGTVYMVKRSLTTTLFPVLLPFSLLWEGVGVTGVAAGEVDGVPVWRLAVTVPKGFFASPQIATQWTVDIDRAKYTVVRAESPFTDLGHGLVADGMRFSWLSPTRVGGVLLPGEQHIVGLDAQGDTRAHSRIDRLTYAVLGANQTAVLFANPIPPDKRPKVPIGQQEAKKPHN